MHRGQRRQHVIAAWRKGRGSRGDRMGRLGGMRETGRVAKPAGEFSRFYRRGGCCWGEWGAGAQ